MQDVRQHTLTRLTSKPGIRFTLVLSRSDGSIITSTGFSKEGAELNRQSSDNQNGSENNDLDTSLPHEAGTQSISDFATTIFNFVHVSTAFSLKLDPGHDFQLLRMHTKNLEVVIFPDTRFLLVAVYKLNAGETSRP